MFTFPVAHFGGELAFTIDQSIRFNDDDSAHLSRTPSSAGNRRTWTFSAWVKRANITGSRQTIFSANNNAYLQIGPDAASREMITILNEGSGTDLNWYTTQVFRDPAAWFHVVWQFDSTQSTADDRTKLYINGSRVTNFTKASTPDQNLEGAINNNVEHKIGEAAHAATFYLDAYLAEINLVDGLALTPDSFAKTTTDGVYQPVEYAGSYGTNGFRITGEDSSDLGADQAGSNNFSSSGLTSADQRNDSPTANHCTLNPLWLDGYSLSDGNLVTNQSGDAAAIGTMAFDPTDSQGFYFEAKVTTAASFPNVGIRTAASCSQVGAVSSLSGNSTGRFAYTGSNGQFNDEGSGSSYGSTWAGTADKVIGVFVKAGELFFSVDGTIQNSGTAAKTGLTGLMVPTVFYDAGSGTQAAWEMRFDASDWSNTPSGYKALTASNLEDPSIPDPSLYFQTTLYTGNTSTQSINQSGNSTFQPDWAWLKARGQAYDHALYDAVRGATKEIKSNSTDTEATITNGLTAFESDGFALGNRLGVNQSGENFVAWQWNAGGTSTTNSDGSVSATVMASPTAGFSICKWVHTTSGNYTVGHGLGAVPKMVWVKTLDQGTNWGVFHSDITLGNRLILNTTSAQTTGYWGSNTFNSTVFSIGSARDANSSNAIGYVFAEVEGYSKISSYVGNGSTDGTFVFTGFKPAWVLLKRTNATQEWQIYDNQRDPFNVANHKLEANSNSAESILTSDNNLDFLSNGFKLRQGNGGMNASGSNYIYMAFAESPFKTATAR